MSFNVMVHIIYMYLELGNYFRYLKKSDQLSVKQRRKAKKKIKHGVQHMLTFRKKDGSYSIWTHSKSSTW